MIKSLQFALVLSLLLPLGASADAQPSRSGSFKNGFSSQKAPAPRPAFGSFGGSKQATQAPPPRAPSGGFGSFGGSKQTTQAPPPRAPSGGFGSFGNAPKPATPLPQKSDSALSQRLDKNAQQANALRTLDERKAAQAAREARPVPGYEDRQSTMQAPPMQMPPAPMPAPAPIIVRNDNSGLMNVVTGFMLARATSGAHAGNNGYPGPAATTSSVPAANPQPAPNEGGGFFSSVLRTFAWLLVLSIVGWVAYFIWKFLRRGKAQNKSNYAFERN